MNILSNPDFKTSLNGKCVNWRNNTVKGHISPEFLYVEGKVSISATGTAYIFGYWEQEIEIVKGEYYRFNVEFITDGIEYCNLSILNSLYWIKDELNNNCACDSISAYTYHDGVFRGEGIFKAPLEASKVSVQLSLRYAKAGIVTWHKCSLEKCEIPKEKEVRVTVVNWRPYKSGKKKDYLHEFKSILQKTGETHSDIVLFPEFTNRYDLSSPFETFAEPAATGDSSLLAGEMAKKYGMNVCIDILECDGGLIYNTAVIFDKNGNFAGKYRKTHLYWPEARFFGEVPGDEYSIFDLDFGRTGIMICYDNWYPEVARLLALKGAEIILYPNEGYDELIMPARAIDNRVYIAISSLEMPSEIFDAKGNLLCKCKDGIVTANINLAYRPGLYPGPGGTMYCSAGGRRNVQNAVSGKLYQELISQMASFTGSAEGFTDTGIEKKGLIR